MGITRLANVTGLDVIGIPVYMCIRPNSRNLSVSQGKGLDPSSAKASALMESIESWHAESLDLPLRHESQSVLRRTTRTLDLDDLTRRPDVPMYGPMLWLAGYDLLAGEPFWVPHELVNLTYVPQAGRIPLFPRSSNGLASGNHILEATSHALCEVIERDAMALWSLGDDAHAKATQLDLATVDDPGCRALLDRIDHAGVGVAAWDITSDLGIPAYTCTIYDRPGSMRVAGLFCGIGCHLSATVALDRAITEAAQSRLTAISGSRDDILPSKFGEARNEDDLKNFHEAIGLPQPELSFGARGSLAGATFEHDVSLLLDALRHVGIAGAAIVDLTKPDLGIPVVKVIVPGLEQWGVEGHRPGARARARLGGK